MIFVLMRVRYRKPSTLVGSAVCVTLVFVLCMISLVVHIYNGSDGVVIIGDVYGRKGSAYTFETAFNELW